jgi:hypothetical protein
MFERKREQRCSMVPREDTEQEEDEWNNNSHPSLSSWCEGNVDESSVVLCPLPCDVSSDLSPLGGWMDGWHIAHWVFSDGRMRNIDRVPINDRYSKLHFNPPASGTISCVPTSLRFHPLPIAPPIPIDRLFECRQRWRSCLPISLLPFRLVFDPIFHSFSNWIHSHPSIQTIEKISLTCSSLGLLLLLLLLYFRTLSISSTPQFGDYGRT